MDKYEIALPDAMTIPSDAPPRMLQQLGTGEMSIQQFFQALEVNIMQTHGLIQHCQQLLAAYGPEVATKAQEAQEAMRCLGGG